GGAGNDTVDASGMDPSYPVEIVFNGGAGNDSFTDIGNGIATYSETLTGREFGYNAATGQWTVTTATEGTDTLKGVAKVVDGASHNVLLVSPTDHFTTIQAAVNAAANGDIIVVAGGTYHENVVINGKSLTIEGLGGQNGAGGAVLAGSITETGALGGNLTIDGLTINATGQQYGISLTPTLAGPETVTVSNVSVSG